MCPLRRRHRVIRRRHTSRRRTMSSSMVRRNLFSAASAFDRLRTCRTNDEERHHSRRRHRSGEDTHTSEERRCRGPLVPFSLPTVSLLTCLSSARVAISCLCRGRCRRVTSTTMHVFSVIRPTRWRRRRMRNVQLQRRPRASRSSHSHRPAACERQRRDDECRSDSP